MALLAVGLVGKLGRLLVAIATFALHTHKQHRSINLPDTHSVACGSLFTWSATRGTEFASDPFAFLDGEDAVNGGQLDTFFST